MMDLWDEDLVSARIWYFHKKLDLLFIAVGVYRIVADRWRRDAGACMRKNRTLSTLAMVRIKPSIGPTTCPVPAVEQAASIVYARRAISFGFD